MSEPTNESAEPSNEPANGLVNEPTSEPMGFPQRAINIFFSPGQVFQSLREHPSFIPPIIVVVLLSMATVPVMAPVNEKVAIEQMRQQNPDVTQEQIDQVASITSGPVGMGIGMVAVVIMVPVMSLLMTLIFRTLFQAVFGGNVSFKHALSVLTHASLINILSIGVTILMTYSTQKVGATLSLGVLVPFLEEENIIYIVLNGIDVFTGWWLCLLSISFGILYDMPTMRSAKVFFGLWVLWIAGKTAFVMTFGSIIPGM
jgi:hypothetical protein